MQRKKLSEIKTLIDNDDLVKPWLFRFHPINFPCQIVGVGAGSRLTTFQPTYALADMATGR